MRSIGAYARRSWRSVSPTAIVTAMAAALAPLVAWSLAEEDWRTLMLIGGVGAAALVIRWPVVTTFGIYAFFVPFDDIATVGGGATLPRLLGVATAAALLGTGLIERRLSRPPAAALWWGLLLLWAAMSAAWAVDAGSVLRRLPTALSLYLLYLVATAFRVSRTEFSWVCALTVAGGIVAAAMTYLFGFEGTDRAALAIGDEYRNPNAVAARLALPLALAVGGVMLLRSLLARAVSVSAVAVIGLGVFVTMSRTALLGIVSMIAVLMYRARARGQVLLVVIVLASLVVVMPERFFTRIAGVFSGEDATGAGRTDIWGVGIEALERYGLIGAGLSNFTVVYGRYAVYGPNQGPRGAHNTYLGTWVELGLPGLALLAMAVISHLLASLRVRDTGKGRLVLQWVIEAACVSALVSAFFGDRLWMKSFWAVWILLSWAVRINTQVDTAAERVVPADSRLGLTARLRLAQEPQER